MRPEENQAIVLARMRIAGNPHDDARRKRIKIGFTALDQNATVRQRYIYIIHIDKCAYMHASYIRHIMYIELWYNGRTMHNPTKTA